MDVTIPAARRIEAESSILAFEKPSLYRVEIDKLIEKADALGGYYQVKIGLPFRRRSTGDKSQNHHFNGHVQQIAGDTGNDFADVKLAIKRRTFRRGLRYKTKGNDEVIYSLADHEPLPISETDMSVEECAWCIDETHILAAELGIILREDDSL